MIYPRLQLSLAMLVFAMAAPAAEGQIAGGNDDPSIDPERVAAALNLYRTEPMWAPRVVLPRVSVADDLELTAAQRQAIARLSAEHNTAYSSYRQVFQQDPEIIRQRRERAAWLQERATAFHGGEISWAEYASALAQKDREEGEEMMMFLGRQDEYHQELIRNSQRAALDLLLPHQRQRLSQVLWYVGLARARPLAMYSTERAGEFLPVNERQLALLRQQAEQLAPVFERRVQAMLLRYHRQIQSVLPEDQRRAVGRIVPEFRADLPHDDRLVESVLEYEGFRSLLGRWTIDRVLLARLQIGGLVRPLETMDFGHGLELMESQRNDIGLLTSERDLQHQALRSNPREALALHDDAQVDDQQLGQLLRQRQDEIHRQHHADVLGHLLSHQKPRLALTLLEHVASKPQPFGIYGRPEMANWFGLEPAEAQRLAAAAAEALIEFQREYQQVLTEFENRVRSVLDRPTREALEAQIGRPFVDVGHGVLP